MSAPRCSLPDIIGSEDMLRRKRRRKRYALSGMKWHKTDLTWRCVSCHTLVVFSPDSFITDSFKSHLGFFVCFLPFKKCLKQICYLFQQCPQLPITFAVTWPDRQLGGHPPESRLQSLERRSPLEFPQSVDRQQRGYQGVV